MKTDDNTCVVCGVGGADIKLSDKKMCTTCEQKVEHCNQDGSPNNTNVSSSNGDIDNTDAVSAGLERMKISNGADISDDRLFQNPPPKEDCPICFLPMPYAPGLCGVMTNTQPCCGKIMCGGCIEAADQEMQSGNMKDLCPLCRVPNPRKEKEKVKSLKKRMKLNDAEAFYSLGCHNYMLAQQYATGGSGLPKYMSKTIELWNKAAELGSIGVHYNLAVVYYGGQGVERDIEIAIKHYKLSAIGGHEVARHNLGHVELQYNDNIDRAMKHFMIAARSGYDGSLEEVGKGYKAGHVTKDEYASTLRAYQASCDEMKSGQREEAAAARRLRKGSRTGKGLVD